MDDNEQEMFERKVKRFDGWLIQIIVNVFVSVLTTTIVLHCAGITF